MLPPPPKNSEFTKGAKEDKTNKDKSKTSPSQERRLTLQMIEQANIPMTNAIEKLVETLNNKLDNAIETKYNQTNDKEKENQFESITDDTIEENGKT